MPGRVGERTRPKQQGRPRCTPSSLFKTPRSGHAAGAGVMPISYVP
jgi:hypothetical protein